MRRFSFYRGGIGMWAWVLHRATGLGVLGFLLLHIADTSLVMAGPDAYNHLVIFYRHPFFRVLEVLLFASVLYHALNGVRITLIDFSELATLQQRTLLYVMAAIFALAMTPAAYLMLAPILTPRGAG
ncbi:MAG: succinate dehydrogenase, cytochrome b556 subunit [Chloroflexi bacterium]|nr:succinate dehydrogenase, cytochrome b556 subunit [Chloroflexota bacterium]